MYVMDFRIKVFFMTPQSDIKETLKLFFFYEYSCSLIIFDLLQYVSDKSNSVKS